VITDLLDVVGLTDQADTKIKSLSGGQRRRMDVAIGIVGRPELLFLDEPTAGFDPDARREFHDLVHRLADLEGTTIMVTSVGCRRAGAGTDSVATHGPERVR
jgi:ABC-2 type transport system ATP-binding protein